VGNFHAVICEACTKQALAVLLDQKLSRPARALSQPTPATPAPPEPPLIDDPALGRAITKMSRGP